MFLSFFNYICTKFNLKLAWLVWGGGRWVVCMRSKTAIVEKHKKNSLIMRNVDQYRLTPQTISRHRKETFHFLFRSTNDVQTPSLFSNVSMQTHGAVCHENVFCVCLSGRLEKRDLVHHLCSEKKKKKITNLPSALKTLIPFSEQTNWTDLSLFQLTKNIAVCLLTLQQLKNNGEHEIQKSV